MAGSPHLVRLLDAGAPLNAPSRHAMDGLTLVELGRSERASAARDGSRLVLGVPDARMSERHARLVSRAGRWVVKDAGSKNGTHVNGAEISRAVLGDGNLFQCGRTFFMLRDALLEPDAPPDLFAEAMEPLAPGLATLSPLFAREISVLARVAPAAVSLVLIGETGAGKEVVARAAHALSGRRGPLVAVNCGALAPGLVEGALFGHRKGAFSGATEDRPGLIRAADGGTLLLDEIGDLPAGAQAALLRVLQEREVMPVGATRPIPISFRLIVAAQRPLEELVQEGRFRADLLARVSGCTIAIPPLRERLEDVGLLCAALLRRLSPRPDGVSFAASAARALLRYRWPLNIRELEKALEGALARAGSGRIELAHLPPAVRADDAGAPDRAPPRSTPPQTTAPLTAEDRTRREELIALLIEHSGNVSAVARALKKDRVQIRRWLQRYALDPGRHRP